MIHRFHACVAAVFVCVTFSAVAAGQLELVTPPSIVIATDTATATGTIVLRNSGDATVAKPKLVVGAFVSDPAGEPLAIEAKLTMPTTEVREGETVEVSVALSNVTEPGKAKAELSDGARKLGELGVVKKVFPFNVAPLGYDATLPFPVHLIYGQPASVTLLNSDPITHSIAWSIRTDQRELASGVVPRLRPNDTAELTVENGKAGFLQKLEGTLQAPQTQARLLLRAIPQPPARASLQAVPRSANGDPEYWLSKQIPLQLRRTAGDGAGRDLRQTGLILLLLLAGGLTTLYLTYWVPNMVKKIKVSATIEELTAKIHMLRRTPPTLRVLLSVRRNQLRSRLASRMPINLDFLALATELEKNAAVLRRQIELTQKIEQLLIDIEREWMSGTLLGPTILNRAMQYLQTSIAQLEQGELTEDDMRAIEAQVAQATEALRASAEDPTLTASLVARAAELQKRKAELQPLLEQAPGLASALTVTDPAAVVWPSGFWKLDYAVTKMEVAASVPAAAREKVLTLLRLHSFDAFEEAIGEARQAREQITPDEVKAALQSKAAHIHFRPELPKENALVSMELKLDDPRLNAATARRTFTCRWEFGDGFHEDGWRVSHYYAHTGTFEAKVKVSDRNGWSIVIGPVPVKAIRDRDTRSGAITRIELLRLGVALLVVLLGMLGGAKEQLAKLDFVPALVAVFLLGVASEQIKNLLAPKT